MKRLLTIILTVGLAFGSFAQTAQLKLPEDAEMAAEAKRRFVLAVDEISLKNYSECVKATNWMIKNTPDLNENFYINGYKAYEALAEEASGETKEMYIDSMFVYFNTKEEVFGLTDREKNNRAYRYFKYWKTNRDKIEEGFAAYQTAYENPNKVINNNLVSYMDMARRVSAYKKSLTDDQILDVYFTVNEVIDQKAAAGVDAARIDRYREAVTGILIQTIGEDKLNCDFINNNLATGLDQKEDPNLAKKVFGLLLSQQCSDSPYFEKAALIIQKSEPTQGMAKVLAQRAFGRKDYETATKYYDEAITLSATDEDKGNLKMDIAKLYLAQGEKAQARKAAVEAAEMNADFTAEAYSFIGNLYMGSFNDCAQQKSQIDDRAIFMIAYDAFNRAGDRSGMAQAKAQFPTVSDVFTANKKEGDSVAVGCWIQRSTTIRTRPSE